MGYRTLKIGEQTYKYTIGKKFTKVVDFGSIENHKIGNRIAGTEQYVVKPKNVRNWILGLPVPEFARKDGSMTTELAVDPFHDEICGKIVLVVNDPEMLAMRAEEI